MFCVDKLVKKMVFNLLFINKMFKNYIYTFYFKIHIYVDKNVLKIYQSNFKV